MTHPITEEDLRAGFTCGQRDLDQFFTKHALSNDQQGIGKTFVLRRQPGAEDPPILGFYTLSMATVSGAEVSDKLTMRLPRYPLPVARSRAWTSTGTRRVAASVRSF